MHDKQPEPHSGKLHFQGPPNRSELLFCWLLWWRNTPLCRTAIPHVFSHCLWHRKPSLWNECLNSEAAVCTMEVILAWNDALPLYLLISIWWLPLWLQKYCFQRTSILLLMDSLSLRCSIYRSNRIWSVSYTFLATGYSILKVTGWLIFHELATAFEYCIIIGFL